MLTVEITAPNRLRPIHTTGANRRKGLRYDAVLLDASTSLQQRLGSLLMKTSGVPFETIKYIISMK